ncbi:hypothetical protein [Paenibacillus sp. JCM 10914]|uniref:hypothetical protein n=1 Tax=Paenibacillus sp. JCM 10914 TaxID=1236974 RepID=UPI00055F4C2E|nr:hypothetical protein [Paenibacillus sp. JCM 10914]
MSFIDRSKRILSALIISFLVSLTVFGQAHADTAQQWEPGALTPPPPVEHNLNVEQSLVANKYLYTFISKISRASNTQANIQGTTNATQTVDSIGINYILQRWTGSAWVDAGSAYDLGNNRSTLVGNKNFSIQAGYYYRGKTTHWVNESGTYEEGTYYTDSMLMGS